MPATETGPDATTHAPDRTPDPRPAPEPAARLARILLLLAITAAAFNLRPAVASFGPLLDQVRTSLHMSPVIAGVLTALPSLCFALLLSLIHI